MIMLFRHSFRAARTCYTCSRSRSVHIGVLDKILSHKAESVAIAPSSEKHVQLTYSDLQRNVHALSNHLSCEFGSNSGVSTRRIASFLPSSSEYCTAMLGTWHHRCAFVPLSTSHTVEELTYFLSDSNPECVLTIPSHEQTITPIARQLGIPVVNIHEVLHRPHADVKQHSVTTMDDPALIVYTSGTTGQSHTPAERLSYQ